LVLPLAPFQFQGPVLQVGDGKPYHRIEQAVSDAIDGSTINVFSASSGYSKTALSLSKRIIIRAVGKICLDGAGFDYSGMGSIPRAILQVQPGGSGSIIEGFEIRGARNKTFNGAGVRISGANDVTVRGCDIHGNDMGIMSDGQLGTNLEARNQRIVQCEIHENGTDRDPGYNHNLYVGGKSVWIDQSSIWGALTGHNLKSRAHFTLVTNSVLYGGSNRQIDCVDSVFTAAANSNLVVFNCILAMDGNSTGNGNMIHFGAESGKRKGEAYLLQSTFYTEFLPPILQLDCPQVTARIDNSIIIDPDPMHPTLIGVTQSAKVPQNLGLGNWISEGYLLANSAISPRGFVFSRAHPANRTIPSMNSSGFALSPPAPSPTLCSYRDGEGTEQRTKPVDWKVGADPGLFKKLSRVFEKRGEQG
jgi:hypothetical protein